MKTIQLTLLALSLTLVAACGGGASAKPADLTSDGLDALNSGDADTALEKFDAALAQLDPASADYAEAKLGRIEALIAKDVAKAESEFLSYADGNDDMGPSQYVNVAGKMTNAKQFQPAIRLLDSGVQRFGKENEKLIAALEKIKREATSAGDDEALKALGGLGYL